MVCNAVANNMDDVAFLLQFSAYRDHRGGHDLAAVNLEAIRPENSLCDAGFIFDCHEQYTFCRTGALPHEDDAGDLDIAAIAKRGELCACDDAHRVQFRP